MASDIDICNNALINLGAGLIVSLSDTTEDDRARICNVAYPFLRDRLLGIHPWRFAMKKAELTRDSEAPSNDWKYSYILPADLLSTGPNAVFNTSNTDAIPMMKWQIFGRRLFSMEDRIWIDYTFRANEETWPIVFADFVVSAMCARIGFAITDQQSTAQYWQQQAWGLPSENMQGGQYAEAMTENAQNSEPGSIMSDDLIAVRQ